MILRTRKFIKSKKGSALVEYGLLVAGVALVAAAGVSILGHKTSDLVSSVAAVLPGAHPDGTPAGTGIARLPAGKGQSASSAKNGLAGRAAGCRATETLTVDSVHVSSRSRPSSSSPSSS